MLESEIAGCTLCRDLITTATVNCPPDIRYPPPPDVLTILFVGVAPPKPESHFYAPNHDNLRAGLFKVLTKFSYRCNSIEDFTSYGFFLLHTAKCSYKESTDANLEISRVCAPTHLKREIELLKPHAVCILSKTVGPNIANMLATSWGNVNAPTTGT